MEKPSGKSSRMLTVCMAAGYLIGILLCFAGVFGSFRPAPALPGAASFPDLFLCMRDQALFFLAVWLCGFFRLPFPLCAPILFYRSLLAGGAACLLFRSGLPVSLYFAHTAFSALILLLLLSLGNISDRIRSADGRLSKKDFLEYTLSFLFLTGTALILLLILQFLLLFVA